MDTGGLERWTATQLGLVTRWQCLDLGATSAFIEWRLSSGRWVGVHRGVFQTEPGRDDWLTRAGAAFLAAGDGAAVSHETAARTYGLLTTSDAPTTISIPARRRIARPVGVRLVRRQDLDERRLDDDVWPPRTRIDDTVLDLADERDADGAIALAARACQLGVTWDEGLLKALACRKRHRWSDLLRSALSDVGEGAESTFEVRFVRDVERAHGLPAGRRQQPSGGGRRHHDCGYEAYRVLIELDGRMVHSDPRQRRQDGVRDLDALIENWVTVRASWPDVVVTPCAYAARLARLFATRGWRGAPRACRRKDCAIRT